MIIILGNPGFIRIQYEVLIQDWTGEMIRGFYSPRVAAGCCEGTSPPHVLIVDKTGLSLVEKIPCLHKTANIRLTGEGGFEYRPKPREGSRQRLLIEMDSLNDAIRHALGIGEGTEETVLA